MNLKKAILFIDTSDNKKTYVSLEINGKKDEMVKTATVWTSQVLLPMIDKLLKKNRISKEELTEIKVNTGPGSFTGLRVGVAIANAMAFFLKIPLNGKKGELVSPVYQ